MATRTIPDFRLVLDGVDLTPKFRPRLSSLTLTEKRGNAADELNLVLTDHDGRLAIPSAGAVIALQLGWRGQALTDKGLFKVDEREHAGSPDLLTLKAKSADFAGGLRIRRETSWRDTTLGAVLQDLAARQGLRANVAPALAGFPIPILDQGRESDAALMKRLGREHDAVATIKAGRLLFAPIGAGETAAGVALEDFTLTRASGDQHRWSEAERDSYTGVTAAWHDPDGATQHTVTAGDASQAKRLARVYGSEASAKRAAEAENKRVARSKAKLDYTLALGRPDLYPERKGRISGLKPQIDATRWLIESLTHTLSDGGLVTALQMEAV